MQLMDICCAVNFGSYAILLLAKRLTLVEELDVLFCATELSVLHTDARVRYLFHAHRKSKTQLH